MTVQQYQGAIFDLDGTLVDSMWVWKDIAYNWLQMKGISCGMELSATLRDMTFCEASVYIKKMFSLKESEAEILSDWTDMVIDDYRNRIQLKTGVREFLEYLSQNGVKMVIATSNFREACEAVLQSCGVSHFFSSILTADETGSNKSSPVIYMKSADRMSLLPAQCMVFEDILIGIQTARAAGFLTTAVYDESSRENRQQIEKAADYFITDFTQLLYR